MDNSLEKSVTEDQRKGPIPSSSFTDEAGSAPPEVKPKAWWHPIKQPGSAAQIVVAAVLAIAIGLAVTSTVDEVPVAATAILEIPGVIWLRGLQAIGKFLHHRPM